MKIKNDCTHDKTYVARQRAKRVRLKCGDCGHLGKWTKVEATPKPTVTHKSNGANVQHKAEPLLTDEPGKITKLTGPNSVLSEMSAREANLIDMYKLMTVAELRSVAKEDGISGYSKMKKDDLIAEIVTIELSGELVGS